MACGVGRVATNQISGVTPEISADEFSITRSQQVQDQRKPIRRLMEHK